MKVITMVDNLNKPVKYVPIKSWCENPEDGALEQAENLTELPFIFKHVALMPDTHQGYGMPIGGVIATKGVVIPNAVGVDIGCGMVAIKTRINANDLNDEDKRDILANIRRRIPVGFKHRKIAQTMPMVGDFDYMQVIQREYNKAQFQMGTLGGGNHFIELQKDEDEVLWVMIHSGSRNLGYKIANYYNDIAKELNKKWYSDTQPDLAFLPLDTPQGQSYLLEMEYAVRFAYENRRLMMEDVLDSIYLSTQSIFDWKRVDEVANMSDMINIAHNYARMEHHFGQNVMVHRKGATSAKKGELGIIPGSQGTASYIVEGLGNRESFMSCSHGAGRKMGRKAAQRNLDLELEKKLLDDQGVIHSMRGTDDLDEAPSAYKPIDIVMKEQKDLVRILHKLTPLAVIKG